MVLVCSLTSSHASSRILPIAILLLGLAVGFGLGATYAARQNAPGAAITNTVTLTAAVTVGPQTKNELLQYCFSPGGECSDIIIQWIGRANTSIHVLIYSFTLDDVRDALIQAKARGVDVKIVMERSNANGSGSEYQALKAAGIDIRLDANSADMHNKVMIVDGRIVLSGSMNWSNAGVSRNNENLLVIDSRIWAAAYEAQFQNVYNTSTP
jgi:phosphatidylserine/phosphatidylglycerophosphate/cardiolipin synthase-like enzyme